MLCQVQRVLHALEVLSLSDIFQILRKVPFNFFKVGPEAICFSLSWPRTRALQSRSPYYRLGSGSSSRFSCFKEP